MSDLDKQMVTMGRPWKLIMKGVTSLYCVSHAQAEEAAGDHKNIHKGVYRIEFLLEDGFVD